MKLKRIYVYIFLLGIPSILLVSCEKWLDVQPKNQIDEAVLYQRESGFKDVLTGVYINMASPQLYGREMTFGLVDVIGHTYAHTGQTYGYARQFDYENFTIETIIGSIWNSTYNTIANLNNLIEHLRTADRSLFSEDNYEVILGEALGLRAFLHFDMLRLFAPSYKANPSAQGIPYVTIYGNQVSSYGSVEENLTSIEQDLTEAASLLRISDPIITNRVINATTDDGYLLQRNYRFNYYAVQATRARVALYKSDLQEARIYADEVLHSGKFSWTHIDQITVANGANRDRTFSSEQVLVLNVPKMSENIIDRLQNTVFGTAGSFSLYLQGADIDRLYPEATDWRKLYFWSAATSTSNAQYCTKLWQPEGMPSDLSRRMPLIRLPELYLISAEASLLTDRDNTIARLRELQRNRGVESGIPDGILDAELQNQIFQEYHREFVCEGLLFYYYKRTDADRMEDISGSFDKAVYVLPKPIQETEYR